MHLCIISCMNADWNLRTEAHRTALRAKTLGLSQETIAASIGASQSQVSRVLAGTAKRRSKLFDRVCKYVNSVASPVGSPSKAGEAILQEALGEVWDGSELHAEAMATVIRSLGAFRPPQLVVVQRKKHAPTGTR